MKDRTQCCIYYTFAHGDCEKGFKDVTFKRCRTCSKYYPRKSSKREENIKIKRQKDLDRYNNWKDEY